MSIDQPARTLAENAITPRDTRVSTLQGDRLCIACHYNLSGQPVLREGHYKMLIVRCPECGTVASVQEYPLLGRWASRWAIVLAGLWVLLLLSAWFISALIITGMTHHIGTRSTESFAQHVGELQLAWGFENLPEDQRAIWRHYEVGHTNLYYLPVDQTWWRQQDVRALLADAGGWIAMADWRQLWQIVAYSPLLVGIGVVWSLLLPHIRRRWLPIWPLAIIGLAAALAQFEFADLFGPGIRWTIGSNVFVPIGSRLQMIAMLSAIVPMIVGLVCGRTLARLLVRALLPPRLRSALSGLWTIDRLSPPPGAKSW